MTVQSRAIAKAFPDATIRSAKASSKDRYKVTLEEQDSIAEDAPDDGRPEECFSIGLAAAFRRSLSEVIEERGLSVPELEVSVETTLLKSENKRLRYEITIIVCMDALTCAEAEKVIAEARKRCPFMQAIKRNVPVTIIPNKF